MKQAEAMKLVNTLIIGLQRARSVSKESLEDLVIDGKVISKQVVINVLEGLTPWLHGPKGDGEAEDERERAPLDDVFTGRVLPARTWPLHTQSN